MCAIHRPTLEAAPVEVEKQTKAAGTGGNSTSTLYLRKL